MRRKCFLVLLAICFLNMTGCGNGKETSSVPNESSEIQSAAEMESGNTESAGLSETGPETGESEKPRLRYEMTLTLDDPTPPETTEPASLDLFSPVPLAVREQVTVVNDSADDWTELCFRDFMASVFEADQQSKSFDEYDEDGNLIYSGPKAEVYPGGIRSAMLNGQKLDVRTKDEDPSVVYITLPEAIRPGESVVLELSYDTVVIPGDYRGAYSFLNEEDLVSRTYSLAQFYPMLSIYEDGGWAADPYQLEAECMYTRCADYAVTLRLPEKYTVVASGREMRGNTADGFTDWSVEAENMRDMTIILSPNLSVLTGNT